MLFLRSNMAVGDHQFNAATIAVTSSGPPLKHAHVALFFTVTLQKFNDRRYDGNVVDRTEPERMAVFRILTDLTNDRD